MKVRPAAPLHQVLHHRAARLTAGHRRVGRPPPARDDDLDDFGARCIGLGLDLDVRGVRHLLLPVLLRIRVGVERRRALLREARECAAHLPDEHAAVRNNPNRFRN